MMTSFTRLWAVAPAMIALVALVAAGCSESTTRKDVANAQKNLKQAQQNTQEAAREGQNNIANAQQNTREHMVAKPVTPEQATEVQQNVAEVRHDANQNVADAKEKERAAAADLKTTEQQFSATQEKDAFVKQAEQKLADYDKQIDELKKQASAAEGAAKDAINRQVDAIKSARDRADKALSDLKGADLATWKNQQNHVRMAFQELDNSMKNVR